ncbi:MAG TPA: 4-hydroxybenzoate 3-monooxygenase [Acidobacteriaceae bacterium]|jgi:p-hydroxybenzoate 3-monooxygenase|nr:4-hydroxybenzoate 3-monooxygenase [Acidobacteriaceae bacterium]
MTLMETQVAIVGAGPAGLMLSHLLHQYGIHSAVVECRSREHCETRIRAGVLEQGTVDLLRRTGLAARLDREGMVHRGIRIGFGHRLHPIPLSDLTQDRAITVYGQHEVVKDMIAARVADGGEVIFDCANVSLRDCNGPHPTVCFDHGGESFALQANFIAGCDGFHGVCRSSIPEAVLQTFERHFPFAWLGVLAQAAPSSDELVYMSHQQGFALFSMRSPQVTRLYLQCKPDEDLTAWSDDRIWSELLLRFGNAEGWQPAQGPILQKSVAAMRSFVVEPMQHGRLFLAGDAAHIVPPTGAKGMNLAIADVAVLAACLNTFFRENSMRLLDRYSEICLRRVWQAQRFSCWMTLLLHPCATESPFEHRRRYAELEYLTSSRAAATSLAENYAGLPLEIPS